MAQIDVLQRHFHGIELVVVFVGATEDALGASSSFPCCGMLMQKHDSTSASAAASLPQNR